MMNNVIKRLESQCRELSTYGANPILRQDIEALIAEYKKLQKNNSESETKKQIEILPCPFCSSQVEIAKLKEMPIHFLNCPTCGACVSFKDVKREYLESPTWNETWNRRWQPQQILALLS